MTTAHTPPDQITQLTVTHEICRQPDVAGGTEQPDTGHPEPTAPSTENADSSQDVEHAHMLLWLDPTSLSIHPANVRDAVGDLSGLSASIAAQGVLEALTVVPHITANDDGTTTHGYQLVAGHRRAAAAILAGVTTVPCVLRPDLALDRAATDGDRAGQARHVGAMLAENVHRAGLSAVEEARGVQSMIDLGVSVAQVAKSTGLGRKRVAKAAGVARLDAATAAAVEAADLTLDQAAAIAVYANDTSVTAVLLEAASQGPGAFAHALTRAKHARQEAEAIVALTAELTAAGRRLLTTDRGQQATRISQLAHDGDELTAEAHAACSGSAVFVTSLWNGVQAVEVCTDPAANGHANRYGGGQLPTAGLSEADKTAATEARRATIAGNRSMAAANETRREWVRGFLARRSAPKAALRFAVETLTTDPRSLSRWLSGQSNAAQDGVSADLGIEAPGLWQTAKGAPTLTSGEYVSDIRLAIQLLAHVAGGIESGIHKQTWRNPTTADARWLRFLAGCGYTLAEVEEQVITAVDQLASGQNEDPSHAEANAADDVAEG